MGSIKSNSVPGTSKEIDGLRPFLGIGLLLLSGLGFASSITIASMVVREGFDVNTANAFRYSIATVLLFIYQTVTGKPIKLPSRERYTALALGITVFMMGAGYLGATRYIPVSLAVLIFYTGPFFVLFISRFTEKERITPLRMSAVAIALVGLFILLEVRSGGALEARGILYAFIAALGMAAFVTVSSIAIRKADPQTVNLYTLSGGSLLFIICTFIIKGGGAAGISVTGLLTLCSFGIAISMALIFFYTGLKIIGPVKASMLLNIEPIFTIVLASVMLGEQLSGRQFGGAALVIMGIIMVNHKSGRNEQ